LDYKKSSLFHGAWEMEHICWGLLQVVPKDGSGSSG
jgi:hypothetical protein